MPLALEKPNAGAGLRFKSSPQPRRATTRIVVHHTAGSPRQSVEGVHAYHRSKPGWIGIGYNVIQDDAGVWYEGRSLDKQGTHATSYNGTSIGVCLIGDFEDHELPTHRYESLVSMVAALCRRYGLDAYDVVGHRELPGAATLCPGRHLDLSQLRRDVRAELESAPEPEVPAEALLWRVKVDGVQVGAYRNPFLAVQQAVEQEVGTITLERL